MAPFLNNRVFDFLKGFLPSNFFILTYAFFLKGLIYAVQKRRVSLQNFGKNWF